MASWWAATAAAAMIATATGCAGAGASAGSGSRGGGDQCGETPPPPAPAAGEIAPKDLEASRTAGTIEIPPDDDTAEAVTHSGLSQIALQAKICIGPNGVPSRFVLLHSSCVANYDAKIARAVGLWRYKPYMKDGVATQVCTTMTFIYHAEQPQGLDEQ